MTRELLGVKHLPAVNGYTPIHQRRAPFIWDPGIKRFFSKPGSQCSCGYVEPAMIWGSCHFPLLSNTNLSDSACPIRRSSSKGSFPTVFVVLKCEYHPKVEHGAYSCFSYWTLRCQTYIRHMWTNHTPTLQMYIIGYGFHSFFMRFHIIHTAMTYGGWLRNPPPWLKPKINHGMDYHRPQLVRGISSTIHSRNDWLVVYLPLWKTWVRQWEGWHPI